MEKTEISKSKEYEMPKIEILVLEISDILTVSGGFDGLWDDSLPEYDIS